MGGFLDLLDHKSLMCVDWLWILTHFDCVCVYDAAACPAYSELERCSYYSEDVI